MSLPELSALQRAHRALSALPPAPCPDLRAALRALDRAADDAEAAISEVPSGDAAALARAVASARAASDAARAGARRAAREEVAAGRRAELLEGGVGGEKREEGATKVAEDITAGLRRVTGIVQEELERTAATGGVVDDSSHVLRKTKDVHKGYGSGLDSSEETLRLLRREERNANIFLACCFLAFFAVAFYIAQRRIVNSNTATFIVSPAYRAATFVPRRFLRLVRALARSVFGSGGAEVKVMRKPVPSAGRVGGKRNGAKPPDQGDVAQIKDKPHKAEIEEEMSETGKNPSFKERRNVTNAEEGKKNESIAGEAKLKEFSVEAVSKKSSAEEEVKKVSTGEWLTKKSDVEEERLRVEHANEQGFVDSEGIGKEVSVNYHSESYGIFPGEDGEEYGDEHEGGAESPTRVESGGADEL